MLGINAAVVGILLAAFYDPVWTSAILAPADFGTALSAFALLVFWKAPPWFVVIGCTIAGNFPRPDILEVRSGCAHQHLHASERSVRSGNRMLRVSPQFNHSCFQSQGPMSVALVRLIAHLDQNAIRRTRERPR